MSISYVQTLCKDAMIFMSPLFCNCFGFLLTWFVCVFFLRGESVGYFPFNLNQYLWTVNKQDKGPPVESLTLSPESPSWDLTELKFGFPRNGTLNQPINNHPKNTNEVTCLTGHCRPLKEGDPATTNTPFLLSIASLFLPPSA